MDAYCDLEVDVNGEEVLMVDKKVLSSYSGSIRKMFSTLKGGKRNMKVIYHDFPGGAENFELITRFCYKNGKIDINPFNITDLNCAAYFLEMNKCVSGSQNLLEQTAKSLEDIRYWTWSELIVALKRCQDFLAVASSSGILEKCLDSIVGRVASSCETSPSPSVSSPDSYKFRASCDTRSSESLKSSFLRVTWWFEDLVQLDIRLIEMLVKSMVSRNLSHRIISKFLFHYQKSRLASAFLDEKSRMVETVVEMLFSLDLSSVSYKSLFGMLRFSLQGNISKCSRNKLESMIGSHLDQATFDDFLVPSPIRARYLYDVNLVLRLVKSFLAKGVWCLPLSQLKKVVSLLDAYIAEVAPDPHLKPSKFLALIKALPDSARDSFDGIYQSVDLYLEVHSGLSEEEKTRVCCGLAYEKLSPGALSHLAQNNKFPSKSALEALNFQQCRLKNLLQPTNQPNNFTNSPIFRETERTEKKDKTHEQILLYAGNLDFSIENESTGAHLQGMQWRVLELEEICRKMQIQMTKMMKSRLSNHSNAKSVPRLCS
ncbi:BTB POZ domain-containing At3g22104 [Olea europaea subsp. europaea]|uniref:BTB POZ domain-containing At3g22104 n=2 Tax=Olea europaea subsp. europaea TaxID=158383 RepID=A0A8S0SCQ8_OLEEU|nr:BTB POZ domain-containing At3g22104 [Olea europaea subsp. europaea]